MFTNHGRWWVPLVACVALALTVPARGATPAAQPLVSPAWLATHMEDPSLVILHVATLRDDYESGHIPGARFLWLNWLAEPTPERSFEMPSPKTMRATLERLGVSTDSRIVICHVLANTVAAARVYVALEYLGLGERTAILDGGLEAWKAEGRPVTQETPRFRRGRLAPRVRDDVIAGLEQVRAFAQDPAGHLVDARSTQAYNAPDAAGIVRGGHIPGALNIPASTVVDSLGRYLPPDTLRARFERAGVRPGERLISYCNVGGSACPVFVAARILGHDVRLYDGSFEEWSRRVELPVERAQPK